ncbi:MAG TPA: alpha/beta hydrolase [Ktedonobacterales bacterium]
MDVNLDGVRFFYQPAGREDGYPLILLHGGPGLDHTELHPWLDALGDDYRLIYLDQRGQGRSERVDPASVTIPRLAADVSLLSAALGLSHYALFGHSYGAFVTIAHAVEQGTASHYIISGGSASMTKSGPEIQANLAAFEPESLREQVTRSWAMEASVKTAEDCAVVLAMQMPFHFMTTDSDAYRRFTASDPTVYSPEVLAYAAQHEYAMEYEDRLGEVKKPALVMTGEADRTCTPRAARDLHAGIAGSELLVVPGAGHMTHVEQPAIVLSAIRGFIERHPLA